MEKQLITQQLMSLLLASSIGLASITALPSIAYSELPTPTETTSPLTDLSVRQVKGISEITLPTGQMLYIKEDHSMPIVTIDTWVSTGSVNETPDNNGVSHFLEHLLFKGTKRFQQGQIDRLIESKGATFNAATSDDFTHYYITISSAFFKEALDIHADMLLNSVIPEKELTPERKVVQEEINRAADKPYRNLFIAISETLFKNHGYAQDTLGPKSNIANIPREKILDYYHYWYQPQHLKTVIIGDVDTNEAVALMQKHFAASKSGIKQANETSTVTYQPPSPDIVTTPPAQQIKIIEDPNISQAYVGLAFLAPSIDNRKQATALDVAMQTIGSGKSSPLYQTLKQEMNIVTSVSAGNWTQKYGGLAYVLAEVPPEKLNDAQDALLSTLHQLKKAGLKPEDLDKTKTQTIKDFIFLNESTDGIAGSIGYNVAIGGLEDYTHYVDWIQDVTKAEADDALNQWLNYDNAVVVQVVPKDHYASVDAGKKQTLMALNNSTKATDMATKTNEAEAQGIKKSTTNLLTTENNIEEVLPEAKAILKNLIEQGGSDQQSKLITADKNSVEQQTETLVTNDEITSDSEASENIDAASTNGINKKVLGNGMTLITKARRDSDTVALKIFIRGGKSAETIPGTATLLSTLLKKGTLARTVEDINTELESRGMSLSVSAANDYIMVSGHAVQEDFGELFLILQDVLSQPIFDETEFAKAKEDLKNAIKASHDEPSSIAIENATLNLYPMHPYGNVGKRVEAHLELITQDTVAEYFDTYVIPEQMVISAVGDFDPAVLENYLEAAFPFVINERSEITGEKMVWPEVPELTEQKTIEESKAKQSATWIAQSWLGPDADSEDYAAFKVLNSLVGTGMSSRLFVNLREKEGLAYSIASALPSTKENMRFMLYAGTAPENEAKILAGFQKEIDRLKTELVEPQELKEAKDKLSGAFALAHETNAKQAYYLAF